MPRSSVRVLPLTKPKLASEVARSIEATIVDRGWPVSEVLGREPELLLEYGVGRSVLREAIRILEHRGVARMRTGPGGGLIVTAPDGAAATSATRAYLEYEKVTTQQLFETRKALELSAIESATRDIDEHGIQRLRERVAAEARFREEIQAGRLSGDFLEDAMRADEFHTLVAELSGNPATELMVRSLSQATWDRYRRGLARRRAPIRPSDGVHDHDAIVEAVVAGDAALARFMLLRHLEDLARLVESACGERT